jgi:protein-S-isoprenylcysteine O-methyltransferase Ste14
MKTLLQKITSSILTLTALFGLGFIINVSLISNVHLWVVVIATILMFESQPKIDKADLFNPSDGYSMLGIIIMAVLVTNLTVVEFTLTKKAIETFNFTDALGIFMIFGGLIFRIYAIQKLGKYFSNAVEIKTKHQLFDKGIYGKIRHPSYTGAIICIIGTVIFLHAWHTMGVSLLMIFIAYFYRISKEEKNLTKYFGEKYTTYRQRTGSLFPKIF